MFYGLGILNMDTWQELTIEVKREAEEAASNILIELGSQGVAIDDSADYLGQVDQYGELFQKLSRVSESRLPATTQIRWI